MKGWRYESGRHALAARGVKSGVKRQMQNREADYLGSADATDAFHLGGERAALEEGMEEKYLELKKQGFSKTEIVNRINTWIMNEYRLFIDTINMDDLEYHISQEFQDKRIKPTKTNYALWFIGYKRGMKKAFESMMI